MEETLRKYPPAWVGPRKSIEAFEFEGHTVPANAYVNYSSWVSHHLPHVFPEPEKFRPERAVRPFARRPLAGCPPLAVAGSGGATSSSLQGSDPVGRPVGEERLSDDPLLWDGSPETAVV